MKTCSMCGGYITETGDNESQILIPCRCGTVADIPSEPALRIELTDSQLKQLAEYISTNLNL